MFTEHFPEQQSGDAEIEAIFVSGLFHTFQEWKRQGMSVKYQGKKAFTCLLWKYTAKPSTKPAPVAVAATPTPAPAAEPDFAALAASILF